MTETEAALTGAGADQLAPRTSLVSASVKRVSWIVFGVQLVALGAWSLILMRRFALTTDASEYLHESYLIATGHLDPAALNLHFDLLIWPLAWLSAPWPHGPILLWEQDVVLVATEVIAFRWICNLIEERWRPKSGLGGANLIASLGLLILVANPWVYSSASFDIHPDIIEPTMFALLAAWEFSRGRTRRAWIWVALVLVNGDVAGLFLIGLGLSAFVASWMYRRFNWRLLSIAVALCAVAVGWELFLDSLGQIGATGASPIGTYQYLMTGNGPTTLRGVIQGVVSHPSRLIGELWAHRLNFYSNLAPSGVVGLLNPWTIGIPIVILIVNEAAAYTKYGVPGDQSFPVYSFTTVGLIAVVCWIGQRVTVRSGISSALIGIFAANAILWGAVFVPSLKTTWLRVSSRQASVLTAAMHAIPENAEVLAEQGVIGVFAERNHYAAIMGPGKYQIDGRSVWVILAPSAGIEIMPVVTAEEMIADLAGPLHAQLRFSGDGIWVFKWDPPAGARFLTLRARTNELPAWVAPTLAGNKELHGPVSTWHTRANSRTGYLFYGDYWLEPTGLYRAKIRILTRKPADIEVWNVNLNRLLVRKTVPPVRTATTETVNFESRGYTPPQAGYSGWGPFSILPVPNASPLDRLEIRVWVPPNSHGKIYDVSLVQIHNSH